MFVSYNSQQNIQNASVRNYSQSAEDILKQLTIYEQKLEFSKQALCKTEVKGIEW